MIKTAQKKIWTVAGAEYSTLEAAIEADAFGKFYEFFYERRYDLDLTVDTCSALASFMSRKETRAEIEIILKAANDWLNVPEVQ